MGISGGSSFYHSIKNLGLVDLVKVCRHESGAANPTIYIDCNWVANYVGRSRGEFVEKTIDIFHILSKIGFLVYPVVDGDVRHHSKRISVGERSLKREIARIDVKKQG